MSSETCNRCGGEAHHLHHIDHNHKNKDPENHEMLCTICHSKEHGIEPRVSELMSLVNYLDKVQVLRIMVGNTVLSLTRIELLIPDEIQEQVDKLKELEKKQVKLIKQYFKDNPSYLHSWMVSIKGVQDVLAAKIMAEIDFEKTPTVSALWRYAGHDPTRKKEKGKIAPWNHRLKRNLYQLSDSFIKQRTPRYREVYDATKAIELEKGLTKGHADMRARRVAIKTFLKDLFLEVKRPTPV